MVIVVLDQMSWNILILDNTILDNTILDNTILDNTIIYKFQLNVRKTVLSK